MPSTTIRISESSRKMLYELARQDNKPMQAIVEKAIESYRRQRFLEGLSGDFALLRNNPEKWQDEEEERRAWDITLADGDTK
ncbi:MAG: toxin-antitoxin system protein [Syntrophaceae bacterium]